jgi:hypothetical protein
MNPPEELIDDLQLVDPPEPFRLNWWYVAAAVLAIVLMAIILKKRAKTRLVRLEAAKLRRAWVDALAELEKLFALIDSEQSRPYATESSAIIRHYIEERFDLRAPTQSTEEFLETARYSPKLLSGFGTEGRLVAVRHQEALAEYLRICDLLKFARTLADKQELRNLHDAAVAFVKESRPQKPEGQA